MRVLVDVNLFVSFLLHPDRESAANRVVRAAVAGGFDLLVPAELLAELVTRVESKPYLAGRIETADLAELAAILCAVGEALPALAEPAPQVTRDAKDDYLLAHAVVARAEFLVTGDADLLDLGAVEGLRIVTAAGLLAELERGENDTVLDAEG